MQGYTEAELVGRHATDFLDEKGKEILRQELRRRRLGIKGEYDTEFINKDGTHIHARVGATPLYDNNGNFVGAMGVIVDISALKMPKSIFCISTPVLNALRGINQLITLGKRQEQSSPEKLRFAG